MYNTGQHQTAVDKQSLMGTEGAWDYTRIARILTRNAATIDLPKWLQSESFYNPVKL